MVIDRAILNMEDEYKVACALSNSAVYDDLEGPQTRVSRSQYSLKVYICIENSASDLVHVWF